MRTLFYSLLLALLFVSLSTTAQTTLSGGEVTGTLTKAQSPYTITADLIVPVGESLTIEPGVEMYFNQHIGMDVYGQITAEGTANDSIIFTASDTALGWYGIRIRKTSLDEEEQAFSYCRFSRHFLIKKSIIENHGVLLVDSVNSVNVNHCVFSRNRAANSSGLTALNSTVSVNNSIFRNNLATDTNLLLDNAIDLSAFGSAAGFGNCRLSMNSCIFEYNKSYTPYFDIKELGSNGGGIVMSAQGLIYVSDCIFRNNQAQNRSVFSSGGSSNKKDSLFLTNCTFLQNQIKEGSILYLSGSSDNQYNAVITDCIFEENYGPDSANYTSTVAYYNAFGSINEVTMERCTLLNNDNYQGIDLISSSRLYFNNGTIMGQNGFAFDIRKSVNCRILNSIIANNYAGINANFNSQLGVINSIVAYNGNEPDGEYRSSHGIYLGDRGRLDLMNSIVTNNVGSTGRMANITSTTRAYFSGYLHNTILEGGTDSSYKFRGGSWDIEEGSTNFLTIENLITKPVTFANPPAGVGRAYASLSNDFHIVQNCDSTPVYDQGDFFNPPYPLNSWNDIDRDGNPRIQGQQMDIGPYELAGEKFTTTLQQPWRDTILCDNDLGIFNPIVLGANVDYTWQRSADKSTWNNLPASGFNANTLIDAQDGYYRLITEQKECNVVDTFGVAQLSILEAPEPDLGEDKYIGNDDKVWLTPGLFSSYRWNIFSSPRDTSHLLLDASKYPADSKKIVWVEVTAANGCKASDSINVYFGKVGVFGQDIRAFSLYPNPAKDYIRIDLNVSKPTAITILNVAGQVVLHQSNIDKLTTVDVQDLSKGYYTLILSQEGAVYSSRFIKE
jgi:hypothetical protein